MMNRLLLKCLLLFIALASGQVHAAEHVTYYVNDALGSPIMSMDEQGAVVWQESYQPYGQRQVKPAAANYDEQFYTGKQEEPDIGLQYFGARWYDPEAGRFTSIDPVDVQEGEIHSFNRYAYANNNPYRFTDPNGESPLDVAFFTVDALAFGVAVASGNPQAIGSAGTDLAMSAIGLISPVPGTGQALKMVKAGKVLDRISDGSNVAKKGDMPDFIVGSNGTALSTSQGRMRQGFDEAGFPSQSVVSPTSGNVVGQAHILPDGNVVRTMNADGRNPRRASFTNINGGAIDPFTGKPPQPSSGLTRAERKQFVRERSHIVQGQ